MKILHITVVRELSAGQRKQLMYEHTVAQSFGEIDWRVLAFHTKEPKLPFEKRIPKWMSPVLLRNLYGWWVLFRMARKYDFVLCRHMVFDPFALLFARFIRNRVSIHHAKEVEELKLIRQNWLGRLAAWLEMYTGKHALRHAYGVAGVTSEIAKYEAARVDRKVRVSVYPNGIRTSDIEVLPDKRVAGRINLAFICGYFSDWHGLDRLLDSVWEYSGEEKVTLYLIGRVSESQRDRIIKIQRECSRTVRVVSTGHLEQERYRKLLSRCDVGLSSFALELKGLKEAATLKVREYLALGMPVYSGHRDTALSDDFPYYKIGRPSIFDIVTYARSVKGVKRASVRAAAADFIEKDAQMRKLAAWLSTS